MTTPREAETNRTYAAGVRTWRRGKYARMSDAALDAELIAARHCISQKTRRSGALRAAMCRLEMTRRVLAGGASQS